MTFDIFLQVNKKIKKEAKKLKASEFVEIHKVGDHQDLFLKDEKKFFILKNLKNNHYFRLNKKDKFIFDLLDGNHTLRDVAILYYEKYQEFDFEKLTRLVNYLGQFGFIENNDNVFLDIKNIIRNDKPINKIFSFFKKITNLDFPIRKNIDIFFTKFYNCFGQIFFKKTILRLNFSIIIFGIILFLYLLMNNKVVFFNKTGLVNEFFTFYFLSLFLMVFHELAHGLTTKHFKKPVDQIGFMFYFFWPSFYVDTTSMWLGKRKQRIIVSLAGIFSDLTIAGLLSIFVFFNPDFGLNFIFYKMMFLLYLNAFLNLNPLMEWDGYYVLIDVLNMPSLRSKSFRFLSKKFFRKFNSSKKFNGREKIYIIYGFLSSFWTVIALILAMLFWRKIFSNLI